MYFELQHKKQSWSGNHKTADTFYFCILATSMATCASLHIPERVTCCSFMNNMKLLLFQKISLGKVGSVHETLGHLIEVRF